MRDEKEVREKLRWVEEELIDLEQERNHARYRGDWAEVDDTIIAIHNLQSSIEMLSWVLGEENYDTEDLV